MQVIALSATLLLASTAAYADKAMQFTEQLNNFPGDNGRITAILHSDDGQAKSYSTRQQFQAYAMGPQSMFDMVAEKGVENTFAALSGANGAPVRATQVAQAPASRTLGGSATRIG